MTPDQITEARALADKTNKIRADDCGNDYHAHELAHALTAALDEIERLTLAEEGARQIIPHLVAAYQNASKQMLTSDDLEFGHRLGVRDVAVRLGVYEQFCSALTAALDRIEALEAERDTAWNDAIEVAACASETEGMSALNYPDEAIAKSYCDDVAMIIRSLKKGEPT